MPKKSNVTDLKKSLRKEYREMREALPRESTLEEDLAICRAIVDSDAFKNADTVLLYFPVGREIDVLPVFARAAEEGKTVAFPRCETRENEKYMSFRCVKSLDELENGVYNIPCPRNDSEAVTPTEKTLCVVPALVYDAYGYRIGYGGGYYDRFLEGYTGTSLGVVRDGFLFPRALPRELTDKKCDLLADREGVYETKNE